MGRGERGERSSGKQPHRHRHGTSVSEGQDQRLCNGSKSKRAYHTHLVLTASEDKLLFAKEVKVFGFWGYFFHTARKTENTRFWEILFLFKSYFRVPEANSIAFLELTHLFG